METAAEEFGDYRRPLVTPTAQMCKASFGEVSPQRPKVLRIQTTPHACQHVDMAMVGMVGVNFAIPVPLSYYTFGGWKRSGFGDLNQHGPDSIRFYTKTKTVTARWPSGIKEGAEFVIPTMK